MNGEIEGSSSFWIFLMYIWPENSHSSLQFVPPTSSFEHP